MNPNDTTGFYYWMGLALDVRLDEDGGLMAAMPGVPAGYEVVLEPLSADRYLVGNGPLSGETAEFLRDDDGQVTAMHVAGLDLARVPPERVAGLPVVERLIAPELVLTPEKEAAFAALYASALSAEGGAIDYTLPYPKHEFVQYIMAQDVVIFHGTGDATIETFSPVRQSIELRDETGRGNIQGVYGTHDGLWSMFFAVVDRPRLHGSIRNGVMTFHSRDGKALDVYNFSINQHQLADKPWRAGTLYLLPRDSFVRLKLGENAYANEWASEEPVRPIARLAIQPADFPFLDHIGGHDDDELLRFSELGTAVRESAVGATLTDDRFTVTVPASMADQLDEYVDMLRVFVPAAGVSATAESDGVTLVMTALPPAYRQMISDSYRDLLED